MTYDQNKPTVIRYERQSDLVRITITNVTNHEIREVLIGIWSRLDHDERADLINALTSYQTDPASWMSPVAVAIKQAGEGTEREVDLDALTKRGEKVRP